MSYARRQSPPVTDATVALLQITQDPYLAEAACEIMRLSQLEQTGRPGARCRRTRPTSSRKGIGLREVVSPLRAWIWHRQHPYVVPLAVMGLLGLTYYAGTQARRR